MLFAASRCGAQALRKGISVQMAVTRNAIATPDADKEDTSVVAVTHDGRVYFGIDPIAPAALAEKRGLVSRTGEKLYIKADARTAYGNVLKVLDAARRAGVAAPILLTAQQESPKPGTLVPPKGLEVLVGPPLPSGAESVQLLNSGQPGPRLKINQQDIPWAALQSKLRQLFQNRSEKVVVVKADGVLPFSDVVHVVDLCRATSAQVFLVVPGT
jgi:biopolymer transport protein ExbD